MLALDLGVFNRKAHRIGVKEAAMWSVFWISLALGFDALLYFSQGAEVAMSFLSGYLLEKSLSVDNIFVFVMIFFLLCYTAGISAPGALLGHPDRPGVTRRDDPERRRPHRPL